MAQIDILTAQVAQIIKALNDLNANARKTSEFPLQDPIVDNSLVRVEESGVSKHITLSQIIDRATSFISNELLYFSGVTISVNNVTLLTGSVWRIDSVIKSNAANAPFTVPYTSVSGSVRVDLLVGNDDNSVTKIAGSEDDIPIKPNHDNNQVVICALLVTDTSIMVVESKGNLPVSYNVTVASTQDFAIPEGAICESVHVNEGFIPEKDAVSNGWVNNWEQINSTTIRLKKATLVNQRIHITYNI